MFFIGYVFSLAFYVTTQDSAQIEVTLHDAFYFFFFTFGQRTNRFTVQQEKCETCQKTVYPMERLAADKKIYHKSCFKCSECKATLRFVKVSVIMISLCGANKNINI